MYPRQFCVDFTFDIASMPDEWTYATAGDYSAPDTQGGDATTVPPGMGTFESALPVDLVSQWGTHSRDALLPTSGLPQPDPLIETSHPSFVATSFPPCSPTPPNYHSPHPITSLSTGRTDNLSPGATSRSTQASANGRRTVKCSFCDSEFTRAGNMRKHIKEQHQENPPRFQCLSEGCTRSYMRKNDMKRHVEKHHGAYAGVESEPHGE
ncbi:hypothetical protein C8Q80DRAFT_1275147 [Daedaleopsis nitida]|nr:hypothetical protein C8Q80DRAFT_1275147 [Daedaleopsis nitida]